jgi:hypothetical protein
MFEGIATTSSSEDSLGRVKVECKNLWETESTLLPVLNNVYISKGDRVILFSPENLQQSMFVLGKFQSKANQENDVIDSKSKAVLFQARVGGSFVMGIHDEKSLSIETDKSLKIIITSDAISIEVPEGYKLNAKTQDVDIKDSYVLKSKTQDVDIKDSYVLKSKTKEETISDSNKCEAKTQEFKATGGSFKIESKGSTELFSILSDLVNALVTASPATIGSPAAHVFNPSITAALGKAKTDIDFFK